MSTRRGGSGFGMGAAVFCMLAAGLLMGGAAAYEDSPWSPAAAGNFRFLTSSLPVGTTNGAYSATLLIANAAGAVTFTSTALPTGLSLDANTGRISGIPTVVQQVDVTFSANDGTKTINVTITMKINASGGGGNAGLGWGTTTLAQGKVGTAYSQTLTVTNAVGSVRFGGADLPPGLSLGGRTGVISGTPTASGTFFCTFTAEDSAETVILVLPLTVLPAASSFQFTKGILNNGEVGSDYTDTWTTSGAAGPVTYSASGLPTGLSVASTTGVVSGTPTVAGSYLVTMNASDGTDTITMNRTLWIAPSSTSSFYWDYFGLPTAFVSTAYNETLLARNGTGTVTYSAAGLPSGLSINPNSGVLSGTPLEVGLYPVIFTATDSNGSIALSIDFPVLPVNGGDTRGLAVNLWVVKEAVKSTGVAGKDSWQANFIYNADRRTGSQYAFDPARDTLIVSLGSNTITLAPNSLTGTGGKYAYKSPKGTTPAVAVQLDTKKSTLRVTTKSDTFPANSMPGTFRQTATIYKGFKLDERYNEKGAFTGVPGYLNTSFVVSAAKIGVKGGGKDSAAITMFLADPSFAFAAGTSELRFRILNGATVIADKTFTTLVTSQTGSDGTIKMKNSKDTATTNTLGKFTYETKKGKLMFGLKNADLSALAGTDAHVMFELTVGQKTYTTTVSIFNKSGSWSAVKP